MCGAKLKGVQCAKDVGCKISSNLKFSQHCNDPADKANRKLGFIKGNFSFKNKDVILPQCLCGAAGRPSDYESLSLGSIPAAGTQPTCLFILPSDWSINGYLGNVKVWYPHVTPPRVWLTGSPPPQAPRVKELEMSTAATRSHGVCSQLQIHSHITIILSDPTWNMRPVLVSPPCESHCYTRKRST